jgi:hypothetical protein
MILFLVVILIILVYYLYGKKEEEGDDEEDEMSFCLRNSIDFDHSAGDDYSTIQRSGHTLLKFTQYYSRQFHVIRLHFGYTSHSLSIAIAQPLRIELSPGRSGSGMH